MESRTRQNYKQQDLIITHESESEITVDNTDVARFIGLLLSNEKIRDVSTPSEKKAVLILGRFTEERKLVLDALREELPALLPTDPFRLRET